MLVEQDRPATGANPMLPRRFRVAGVWREIDGITSLSLVPVDGSAPHFAAGQFNMLYAFGIGEAAISISGDPAQHAELIHTIRNVGAISGALTRLSVNDMVGVRGPFGSVWPTTGQYGRHLVLVAGGLGLAPLRPALFEALHAKERFEAITLLVGARSPRDILFTYQLADWASQNAIALHVTVDHAAPGWTGNVGVVTTLIGRALQGSNAENVSAFICGPEVMMRHSCMALGNAGVPSDRMWLSMERNMKCAIGLCGHCQYGADFVCKDGPVFRYDAVASRLWLREL